MPFGFFFRPWTIDVRFPVEPLLVLDKMFGLFGFGFIGSPSRFLSVGPGLFGTALGGLSIGSTFRCSSPAGRPGSLAVLSGHDLRPPLGGLGGALLGLLLGFQCRG